MSNLRKRKRDSESNDSLPPQKKLKPDTFVKWNIYSGDNKWTISVFKGTPVNDIKQTITDITSIQNFTCMNAESDIIVLTSYLPNNTNLYVQSLDIHNNNNNHTNAVNEPTNTNNNTNDEIKQDLVIEQFCFDAKTMVSNGTHTLSDNGTTFAETDCKGWGGVMTSIAMKYPNKYIWSTIYSKFCCCYDKFFLINGSKLPKDGKYNLSAYDYASVDLTNGCIECKIRGCAPFNNYPRGTAYELIHVLDMKKKEYWIFAKNYYDPLILVCNLPQEEMYFMVGIKHPVKCTIKRLNQLDERYNLQITEDTKIKRLK